MPPISVTIITHNEERNILRCIESVKPFAAEIVVVDSGSSDHTGEICMDAGCRVFSREFDGFGTQKQFAVDQAANDWIFSIDADEVVSPRLLRELLQFRDREFPGGEQPFDGYFIPFMLNYMGRNLRFSGTGKNLRLFDRRKGKFTLVPVHETVDLKTRPGTFRGRIIHYSYRDLAHHFGKINFYTTRAAEGYHGKGKRFHKCWAVFKFPVTFCTFYFIRLGILEGYPGFMWAFLAAVTASLKVAKTIELNQRA
jgi:glycosyltransferase involved in cell wall biosynthesis